VTADPKIDPPDLDEIEQRYVGHTDVIWLVARARRADELERMIEDARFEQRTSEREPSAKTSP